MDMVPPLPGKADTKVASDHYHRFCEDVALMKECGLKSYRFSISWARILPKGRGEVNQKGIDFYNALINELVKNGIEPIVTLYHFDMPYCLLEEYNGWASRKILPDFTEFCTVCFREFGDRVKWWISINEQLTILFLPKFTGSIPDTENRENWRYRVNHNMTLGHAIAVKLCHEMVPDGRIGPAAGWNVSYPATCAPRDNLASYDRDMLHGYSLMDMYVYGRYNSFFKNYLVDRDAMPEIQPGDMELMRQGKPDYIALNYYRTCTVQPSPITDQYADHQYNLTGKKGDMKYPYVIGAYRECENKLLDVNNWDWALDPIGFRLTLRALYDRYQLPIMITENGLGAYDTLEPGDIVNDDYRIDYIRTHLQAIKDAIHDGVEMLGYNPWSFTDLLSSSNGFEKRYGFVYINRGEQDLCDLRRIRKKSFAWSQHVIKTNGGEL